MSTPYRLWEIQKRANDGPQCDEDDFLPKVFHPKLQEVIKKYGIKWDPKTPVPSDGRPRGSGMAGRVGALPRRRTL